MREQLLGYLLGALEPAEHKAVEARLQVDAELRRDLEAVRERLLPLAETEEAEPEPPPGLAAKTCRFVMARLGPTTGQFAANSQWRPQDIVVAVGILVVGSMLVFPALLNSRANAQLRICQQNLSALGHALIDYSQYHAGSFPLVPEQGNLAVAGIYAPTLQDAGLIDHTHVVCPCSSLARQANFRIPKMREVVAARQEQLRQLHHAMGGSYGYSLGYVENGQYHGLRNHSRATFALMADTPGQHAVGGTCGGDSASCRGQNVLFEDGHVTFMKVCLADGDDHIFQNGLGFVGAGIGRNDAVIAPSGSAPVVLQVPLEPAK